jgi:hypothetical protein
VNVVQVLKELLHGGLRHLELDGGVAAQVALSAEQRLRDPRGVVGLRHELRQGLVPLVPPHEPQALLGDDALALVEVGLVRGDAERSQEIGAGAPGVPRDAVVHPRLNLL